MANEFNANWKGKVKYLYELLTATVTGALLASPTVSGTATFTGLISATGGQIKFPNTQNASADANTLDDYEEGTFTPGLTFGGAAVGMTGTFSGHYIKKGQDVSIWVQITLTAKGSSAGNAVISAIPFTSVSNTAHVLASHFRLVNLDVAGGRYHFGPFVDGSATSVTLQECGDNVTAANLTEADFSNTSDVWVGGVYRASA